MRGGGERQRKEEEESEREGGLKLQQRVEQGSTMNRAGERRAQPVPGPPPVGKAPRLERHGAVVLQQQKEARQFAANGELTEQQAPAEQPLRSGDTSTPAWGAEGDASTREHRRGAARRGLDAHLLMRCIFGSLVRHHRQVCAQAGQPVSASTGTGLAWWWE
jgi:hypothetical protein